MSDTSDPPAPPSRRRGFRWGLVFGGFLVLLLAIAASLLFAPPAPFFTALIQRAVHDATGRELDVEKARYIIRETVTVELDGVKLGRPGSAPGSSLFTARKIRATLPLRSVIDRKLDLTTLELDAPVVNLVREASGTTNWSTAAPAATGTPQDLAAILALPPVDIRNGTLVYRDESTGGTLRLDTIDAKLAIDRRYGGGAAQGSLRYKNEPLTFDLTVADAIAAVTGKMTTLALTIDSRVLKAKLAGDGALGELPLLAGEIDATSPSARELAEWLGFGDSVPTTAGALSFKGRTDPATGAAVGAGSLLLRDTPLTYDLQLADVRQALAGNPTPLAGKIAAADLSATIDGTVALAGAAVYEGQLAARADKIGDVVRRLGMTTPALAALGPGAISGKAKLSAERATLEGAEFDADGRTGTFTGNIALTGHRPRISGDLSISRIDLDALLGRTPRPPMPLAPEAEPSDEGFETTWDALNAELDAVENPPPPTFGLAAAPAAAPAWSTTPIDLTALRAVDLDLKLTAKSVTFGALPLQNARIAAKLDNGELAANIEEITIGAGKGTGAIDLKARGAEHDAAIALKLTGVEAEPITYELAGKPLLKGTSNVDITTRASGKSLDRLVSTLDGNARFDMAKGRLRGWDIGKMVEELWNYKGWGYNPARNTPVDKLTATYTIKAGTVRSTPDLTLTGPTAGLRSVGNVVVPQRFIDQNVKVQNLFFNIVVKGDWTKKLWIGPAFLAGVSPAAPGAQPETPPTAQLPRAMPANIKVRIEGILENPETAARLSPEQKAVLQSLLAAGNSGM
jgi:uncharacterized protein involved in outer membrane biogenesis